LLQAVSDRAIADRETINRPGVILRFMDPLRYRVSGIPPNARRHHAPRVLDSS
jgi:hypothetical protein